ncbi:hypothetical protein H9P43_004764 [Blastocladiella emersonii ATCC 22665]|nr:hypothetical protein H9P43_004764 [Blastocladiella emersonii ATCC 22665]
MIPRVLVAVIACIAAAAVIRAQSVADTPLQRSVPMCVEQAAAKPFGWVGVASANTDYMVQRPPANVTLEVNAWPSSNITALVAAMLLRDVMAVNLTLAQFPDYTDIFGRITRGTVDASLEVWPSPLTAAYNDYVIQRAIVDDLGMIGYPGRKGWFINQAVANANPTIIFDSWRSFQRPATLSFLPPLGTTPPGRYPNGTYLCNPAVYPWCTDGMFIPPQCRGSNATQCRELWAVSPSTALGESEQRILSLNLSLAVVYLGEPDFHARVTQCARQNASLCVFQHYSPESLISANAVASVNLPEYTSACYASFSPARVGIPGNSLSCDWPSELLLKLGSPRLAAAVAQVNSFLRFFSLRDVDMDELLTAIAPNGGGLDPTAAACQWIKANQNIWATWIPTPPADYIKVMESISLADSMSIGGIVLVAVHLLALAATQGAVAKYREWLGQHHSIAGMQLIAAGCAITAVTVLAELSGAPTRAQCTVRVWTLSTGHAVLSSTFAAKAWYVHFVHGNKRLSLVPTAGILVPVVAAAVATNTLLLGLVQALSPTIVAYLDVLVNTYTPVCWSTAPGPGAAAVLALLCAFHAALLALAVVYTLRIRSVPLPTPGEAWHQVLAMATILATFALVVPVTALQINYRVQFAVRTMGISLALSLILYLAVVRPVLVQHWHRQARMASTRSGEGSWRASQVGSQPAGNAAAGIRLGRQSASTTRGSDASGSVDGSVADSTGKDCGAGVDEPLTSLLTRIGVGYKLQKMSGIVRHWSHVNLVLLHAPCPALIITPVATAAPAPPPGSTGPAASTTATVLPSTGDAHVSGVQAAKMDPKLAASFPGCFLLRVQGTSHVVQAKDTADAEAWVADLDATFREINALSNAGSVSAAVAGAAAGLAARSVSTRRQVQASSTTRSKPQASSSR